MANHLIRGTVDQQRIELARRAIARLRDVHAGDEGDDRPRPVGTNSALDRTTHGLAVHLLIRCVDPDDLEHELDYLESFLADQLADTLLDGADWDAYDWSV
jgi:hypothetical protein